MTKKIEVPVILLEQLRQQLTGVMDEAPDAACSLIGYLDGHERTVASDAAFAEKFPNLAKESAVKAQAQEVFQFLEFLAERGVHLAKYQDDGTRLIEASHSGGRTGYIDDFYELDRKATEVERTKLLEQVQASAAKWEPQVVQS